MEGGEVERPLHPPTKYLSDCDKLFGEIREKTTTSDGYFHMVQSLVIYRGICSIVCGAVFRGRKVSAHGYHGHPATNHGYQPKDDVNLKSIRVTQQLLFVFTSSVTVQLVTELLAYTAKTNYRNFETNIPRKGISGSQSQFPHSCVCERFILVYSLGRSACSAGGNM